MEEHVVVSSVRGHHNLYTFGEVLTCAQDQDGIHEDSEPSGLGNTAFEWSRFRYFSRAISLHHFTAANRPFARRALQFEKRMRD